MAGGSGMETTTAGESEAEAALKEKLGLELTEELRQELRAKIADQVRSDVRADLLGAQALLPQCTRKQQAPSCDSARTDAPGTVNPVQPQGELPPNWWWKWLV